VWCGVVWCGVVWCGVVWCGVVWCGVVWCGVALVWCGVVLMMVVVGGSSHRHAAPPLARASQDGTMCEVGGGFAA
jgi:hypothetical protein